MARKQTTSSSSPVAEVQSAVLHQLQDARKRLVSFEKELVKRGRAQQKEIESLIKGVRTGKPLKQIEKQVGQVGSEVKKRLDGLQDQVLAVLGVASHDEIVELNRELVRLSKKVDLLLAKKPTASA
jgi:predicted translin family RNA/ssDNA-binding protein